MQNATIRNWAAVRRTMSVSLLWLFVVGGCIEGRAATLYSQQPSLPLGGYPSAGAAPTTADNFVATSDWLVERVAFKGFWNFNKEALGDNDTTREFQIEFYNDNGGSPAISPFAQFRVAASLSHTAYGFGQYQGFYDVTAALPSSVVLAAGQTYWFAGADEGPGSDSGTYFALVPSFDGDMKIAARTDTHPAWAVFYSTYDVGIVLSGTVVPEPSTLLLLGIFAISLLGYRKAKSHG